MSSPNPPILYQVVENVVESILKERVGQSENQEIVPDERMGEEMENHGGEDRGFFSKKGAKNFKDFLAKKEIIGEKGFKEIVSPFKEEIEIK